MNRGKDEAADFFPASKFRDRFYRPDVIAHVLETGDVTKALQAANQAAGIRVAEAPPSAAPLRAMLDRVSPPVVELTVGGVNGEISVPAGADHFTVRYRVRRSGAEPVTRVRCLVDGRPVNTEAPIPASESAGGQRQRAGAPARLYSRGAGGKQIRRQRTSGPAPRPGGRAAP